MERSEAEPRIRELIGQDLRGLAEELGVTVWKEGNLNKGWAGHTIERYLGLPLNTSRNPNLGSWELKVVPLNRNRRQELRLKETMWITTVTPAEVATTEFPESHVFQKLSQLLLVSRIFESRDEQRSVLHNVAAFTLDDPDVYDAVKSDYDLIKSIIVERGFEHLSGRFGQLIQARTKGTGHGSTSRAFYARKPFVEAMLGMGQGLG